MAIRRIVIASLLIALTACGANKSVPPRNLDNACLFLDENPEYERALRSSNERWHAPIPVMMALIYQESTFVGDARPPMRYYLGFIPRGRPTSAYGYAQALDGTWGDYTASQLRPNARRNDIADAADFIGWYFNLSQTRNNIPLQNARNQYLAYHEGHAGYRRGSHENKSWLLRVASSVESRASLYRTQLQNCGKL